MSERFVRWQQVTRENLGRVINLVLGLTTGALALELNLILDTKFTASWTFWIGLFSTALFLISIVIALWCSLNRLEDFRLTARIVREEEKGRNGDNLREQSRARGTKTWRLLRIQLCTFGFGVGLAFLSILGQALKGKW